MDFKLNDNIIKKFDGILQNITKRGAVLAIEGNVGYRKSYTIKDLQKHLSLDGIPKDRQTNYANVECNNTYGASDFNLNRPLSVVKKAIEDLDNDNITTRKDFIKSVTISISTAIPIIGEFTYTAKEVFKDYKEYKRRLKNDISDEEDNLIQNTLDKLIKKTKNKPSVIFFDNFEKADQLSIKFVKDFAIRCANNEISNIIIVFTYNEQYVKSKGYYIDNLIRANQTTNLFELIKLTPFTKDDINRASREIPNYKQNDRFIEYILKNTIGVPGDVLKYIEYYYKNSPFDLNGNLNEDFYNTENVPDSLQKDFSTTLNLLTEIEKNILTTASAFGNEFSINLLKDILNTDPLSLIRQLRSIFQKTNIIYSIGSFTQYNIKTTVYRFTQAFYQKFFYNLIEYEEKLHIHSLIQQNYQKIYDTTNDEEVKKDLASKIAIHSKEAEDYETSKKMFLMTAKIAFQEGNKEGVEIATEQIKLINEIPNSGAIVDSESFNKLMDFYSNLDDDYLNSENIVSLKESINLNQQIVINNAESFDFNEQRNLILEKFHSNEFDFVINKVNEILNNYENFLDVNEKVQFICLSINSNLENGTNDDYIIKKAENNYYSNEIDELSKCLLSNSLAKFEFKKGNSIKAKDMLLDAAKRSLKLPIEFKLLTISNIYKCGFYENDDEKFKLIKTIRNYSKKLKFFKFGHDIGIEI